MGKDDIISYLNTLDAPTIYIIDIDCVSNAGYIIECKS